MLRRWLLLPLLPFALVLVSVALADANFDLAGPPLEIKVMRAGKTLSLGEVPNLQAGDRLWLHPDFPDNQAARYIMVAVFLRGSTNPPPKNWFFQAQTWDPKVRDEGIYVTVPANAKQALLFLAPETGGDFKTLRSNVSARPGAFVRASQDLNQASLDRSRLNTYLAAITHVSETDPAALQKVAKVLSRTLNIRVKSDCFDRPSNQQLNCLMQTQNAVVVDDSQTSSMISQWTSGESAALIGNISQSSMLGGGAYSPYVGAVVDVVRIMNSIHTAQYQYIPALSEPHKQDISLKLNNPPSFSNPKSVLTIGLPAIQSAQLPPMRALHPDHIYCVENPSLLLPIVGAPLVYSTRLGHNFVLHIQSRNGNSVNLPAQPVAVRGGFAVDTSSVEIANMEPVSTGTLRGYWGFELFDGPSFQLVSSHPTSWALPDPNESSMTVGRSNTLHITGDAAPCVNSITVQEPKGQVVQASYKLVKPDELMLGVPLLNSSPGTVTLLIHQAGMTTPDKVKVQAYAAGPELKNFIFHAGDQTAILEGTRLDQVSKLAIKNTIFTPSPSGLKSSGSSDQLMMTSTGPVPLKAGEQVTAYATLEDGRVLTLPVVIERARPTVLLVSKAVVPGYAETDAAIHLTNQNELPQDGVISFVLRSPSPWTSSEKIEVATVDNAFHTTLDVGDGSLMLQDANTVLAKLNPLKSFGPSAFGPLRFRPFDGDAKGNWQSLGNLVRIPTLKNVHCPVSLSKPCTLSGSNLFLLDSVSSSSRFRPSVEVPIGFADPALDVPRPFGTLLYIKLRDDPTAINVVSLPVLPSDQ